MRLKWNVYKFRQTKMRRDRNQRLGLQNEAQNGEWPEETTKFNSILIYLCANLNLTAPEVNYKISRST
jgi:hypothetical protein